MTEIGQIGKGHVLSFSRIKSRVDFDRDLFSVLYFYFYGFNYMECLWHYQ